MQSLNLMLFNLLGAGFAPDAFWLEVARSVTAGSIGAIAALLAGVVWRHPGRWSDIALALACAGCVAMLAHALAAWIASPRPFMLGLSPSYVTHTVRSGQPSTHASAMTALAVFLLLRPRLYRVGLATGALMLATGWARIYLGLHFPLDILGGIVLGTLTGAAAGVAAGKLMPGQESAEAKPPWVVSIHRH